MEGFVLVLALVAGVVVAIHGSRQRLWLTRLFWGALVVSGFAAFLAFLVMALIAMTMGPFRYDSFAHGMMATMVSPIVFLATFAASRFLAWLMVDSVRNGTSLTDRMFALGIFVVIVAGLFWLNRYRLAAPDRARQEAHAGKLLGMRQTCNFPPLATNARIVALGSYTAPATANVSTEDGPLQVAHVVVPEGGKPWYFILTSDRRVIWHFSGATHRVASAYVVPSNYRPWAGASGLIADQVVLAPRHACFPVFTEAASAKADILTMFGRSTEDAYYESSFAEIDLKRWTIDYRMPRLKREAGVDGIARALLDPARIVSSTPVR